MKAIGYIVTASDFGVCHLDKGGVLWCWKHAHLFRQRRSAQRAIERTMKYGTENGLKWNKSDYKIATVRPA